MKTISEVHSPQDRLRSRAAGERRAQRSQLRLIACVAILRTAITRVLPLCGSAGWWMCLVCLVPAVMVYGLCRLAMRMTDTRVLGDCLRRLMGQWAVWVLSILLALALVFEGVSSMTALITLFTEGIGSEGTQTIMAALTAAALLCCLNREGLARGVYFLRWPMLLALAVVALNLLFLSRADGLFPWLGMGESSLWLAFRAGAGMGWPLLLLLTIDPVVPGQSRMLDVVPPVALSVVCILLINLSIPCELLVAHSALADTLLLPISFMTQMVKTLGQCLWMLILFLQIASLVRLGADQALAPTGREWRYLSGILVLLLAATQWLEIRALWQALGCMEPWLLVPFALVSLAMLISAVINFLRRKTQ